MARYTWLGWYQLAVWLSIAALAASYVEVVEEGLSLAALAVYGLTAALTGLWMVDYWRYAEAEWGDFQPHSATLALVWPFLYALAFMALESASLLGVGGLQLAVVAGAMVALAVVAYVVRREIPPITSGDVVGDIKAGTKTLPLALAMGVPFAFLFFALLEGLRMWDRGARVAGTITIFSAVALPFLLPYVGGSVATDALSMQLGLVEVLLWPGAIGWEELVSRFMLPHVGFAANYMFVVFHAPSRTAELLFAAPAVLGAISMATRWVTDVFRERRSLVAAITAHAVYNGMVGWLYGMFLWPAFTILSIAVLAYAYITRPRGWA